MSTARTKREIFRVPEYLKQNLWYKSIQHVLYSVLFNSKGDWRRFWDSSKYAECDEQTYFGRNGSGKTSEISSEIRYGVALSIFVCSCRSQMQALHVEVIHNSLYLTDHAALPSLNGPCHCFTTEEELVYVPFCDDFGPMNLSDTHVFAEIMNEKLKTFPETNILYCTDFRNRRKLTNSIFLLGSFLILERNRDPDEVWNMFASLQDTLEMYRDATFQEATFRLTLVDCWKGFARAKSLGWIELYDMDEYSHYNNPLEGDLHAVVPGKLFAFKGPKTLPDELEFQDLRGCRHFAPCFYSDIFADEMGISTVIRLNEGSYDPSAFTSRGIHFLDLEFEDCTEPPMHIILEFLQVVERAPGAVAVHCKAGLGRTGTLIALYMMKHHGFSAREAIGWLRIVRPGSVIGCQQQFLCECDAAGIRGRGAAAAGSSACQGPTAPACGGAGREQRQVGGVDGRAGPAGAYGPDRRGPSSVGGQAAAAAAAAVQVAEALESAERSRLRAAYAGAHGRGGRG